MWYVHKVVLRPLFSADQNNWNLEMLVFTGVPGEKPSEQGREPTTNSTNI